MTETPDQKMLWFNFLKIFTRALVQINLYKPDHPQVRQALEEGQSLLAQIAEALGGGDFSLTLDNDKLLVNGVQLITADKLPNSLRNLFVKFRIQTITFSPGVSGDDLLSLCQVQAHKGEAKDFLKERGITRVKLNEAVYAKVDASKPGAEAAQAPSAAVQPAVPASVQADVRMAEKISAQSLESALSTVIGRVTSDPEEQKRINEILTAKLRQEIEAGVERALTEVRREKKKVENDMARTESVMTSMAEGVVVVDKDGKILMMNPQAEAISGKPLAELSGKKIMDLSELESQVVSLAREIRSENKEDISKEVAKSGAAGTGHRRSRADHLRPYGRLYAATAGVGPQGHDRQGIPQRGSGASHTGFWRALSGGHWRCRGAGGAQHQKIYGAGL